MQAIARQDFLSRNFENIVFAGGGNRCWWQAGFVKQLTNPDWPDSFLGSNDLAKLK
jgi:hypothetical protein